LNDVPTHFVTFCPRCSTGLRVGSAYKGQQVQGKQCNDTFPAEKADGPYTTNSNGGGAVLLAQARPKEARIVVPCPECAATLRVRHPYVGHRVACKRCAHAFIASWPTESPLHPAHACPPATTATAWIERRAPWARGSTSRRGSNQAGLHSRNVPTRPEDRGAIRPIRAVLPPTPAYWPGLAGSVSMPVTVELMAFGSDRLD
jgi:DNA-directed RNA polymerase subunit M/transcription elongation factor TFIIS